MRSREVADPPAYEQFFAETVRPFNAHNLPVPGRPNALGLKLLLVRRTADFEEIDARAIEFGVFSAIGDTSAP